MPGTFPASGDLLQIRVGCATVDQAGLNVLHYVVGASTGGIVTLANIADAFDSVFAPLYKACLAPPATYRGVGCTNLTGIRTLESVANTRAGPGTSGINLAPPQCAGLLSYKSGFAGAANRGRSYIPFPSSVSTLVDGTFNPTYVTALSLIGAAIAANRSVVNGAGNVTLFQVIKHSKDLTYATVLQQAAHQRVATQRRRGGYGRLNVAPF